MFLHFFNLIKLSNKIFFLKNSFKNLYFTNTFNNIFMGVTWIGAKFFEIKYVYLKNQ